MASSSFTKAEIVRSSTLFLFICLLCFTILLLSISVSDPTWDLSWGRGHLNVLQTEANGLNATVAVRIYVGLLRGVSCSQVNGTPLDACFSSSIDDASSFINDAVLAGIENSNPFSTACTNQVGTVVTSLLAISCFFMLAPIAWLASAKVRQSATSFLAAVGGSIAATLLFGIALITYASTCGQEFNNENGFSLFEDLAEDNSIKVNGEVGGAATWAILIWIFLLFATVGVWLSHRLMQSSPTNSSKQQEIDMGSVSSDQYNGEAESSKA